MPTIQRTALRHASCIPRATIARASQRRWAQVHDVRFLATREEAAEKIYDRYRHKLDKKAHVLGMRNVDELKKAFRRTNIPSHPVTDSGSSSPLEPHKAIIPESKSRKQATVGHQAAAAITSAATGIKTLSSFLDVEKTIELPPREVESLWRLRHATTPQSICASIPTKMYRKMEDTARRHPQFILPLAREGQGAEIHFLQWTFPSPETATVLFTNLAEYKLRGEFAQPHTTVTHHLEMADSKGLVLVQGTVLDNRGVSVDEGRMLLMQLQKFYGTEEKEKRGRLLRQFNSGDAEFNIQELVSEAEKIL